MSIEIVYIFRCSLYSCLKLKKSSTILKHYFSIALSISVLTTEQRFIRGQYQRPVSKHIFSILTGGNFLRVHKSFIVAIDKIKFIEGNRILINEHKIAIGQTYKSNISNLYSN